MNIMALQIDDDAAVRAELEEAIRAVWVDTLELSDIDRDEDFFDLGGHSLIGLEVTQKIRALLGADQFPVDLVATPTIATLADAILARLRAVGAA